MLIQFNQANRLGVTLQRTQKSQESLAAVLEQNQADAFVRQVRFGNDSSESQPQLMNLTEYQQKLMMQVLADTIAPVFKTAYKRHKREMVGIKLEVGQLPKMVLLKNGTLHEQPLPNTTEKLTPQKLALVSRNLNKDLSGPDSKAHKAVLSGVIQFVDLEGAISATKAAELEKEKLKGQPLDVLVGWFPFHMRKNVRRFLEKGQEAPVEKIRIANGQAVSVKYRRDEDPLATITGALKDDEFHFVLNQVEQARQYLRERSGKQETGEVRRMKGYLRRLLKLVEVNEPTVDRAVAVPTSKPIVPSEPKTLEPGDFDILKSLLPEHLQGTLEQVPQELRQNLHGIEVGLNKPLRLIRNMLPVATGDASLSLNDVNQIEQALENLKSRPKQTDNDDPALYRRAQIRLKALFHFNRTLEVDAHQQVMLPDPNVDTRNKKDFGKLLDVLPTALKTQIEALESQAPGKIEEIELDLERNPVVLMDGRKIDLNGQVSREDIEHIKGKISQFGSKDRSGIPGTLHRISPLRNKDEKIVGLTLRVGRALDVSIAPLVKDLEAGHGLLILGEPGVGKTTLLRKISRHMSLLSHIGGKPVNGSVVVVDTSNEIAGDGDVPHPFLARARRLQVPSEEQQYELMRRAVQNHRAKVVVIDEIGLYKEAQAAAVIAKNGGMLVATAHGNDFDELLQNKELAHLMGNPREVTVGDEMMKSQGLATKTQIERSCVPPFKTLLVMKDRHTAEYYQDLSEAIDARLKKQPYKPAIIHFSR